MGFFGDLWEGVKAVGRAVADVGKAVVDGVKTVVEGVANALNNGINTLANIDDDDPPPSRDTPSKQPAKETAPAEQTAPPKQTAPERVARQRSYDVQTASIDQSKQLDEILQEERSRRRPKIDRAERQIREAMKEIQTQIKTDIPKFEKFGLKMDSAIVDQQFELLEQGETLVSLVNRRYSLSDAECRNILKMNEGEGKKQRMKQFGREIVLKGGKKYFDRLSQTCDVVFNYIDDAAGRHTATQNAEMERYATDIANFSQEKEEQERQKAEKHGRLQRLESLEKLLD